MYIDNIWNIVFIIQNMYYRTDPPLILFQMIIIKYAKIYIKANKRRELSYKTKICLTTSSIIDLLRNLQIPERNLRNG